MHDEPTVTRVVRAKEVAQLLKLEDCITAVEEAFCAHANGRTIPPGTLGVHVDGGAFHIKAAGLLGDVPLFAAKINGNFYANERFGLPRIQGLIVLCNAANGFPLAVMDSIQITGLRTAAATAVAAKYLARDDAETVTIVGCGLQGRTQLAALRCVRRIQRAWFADADIDAAARLAASIAGEIDTEVVRMDDLERATRQSEICVTCTPSRAPFLRPDGISAGTFIAAVGADSEEKQELDAALLRAARVVVDNLEQCASIGELHHALEAQLMSRPDVHAELAEVVAGTRPGRTDPDQVFVFDSTGVALQDVAAAALVYERAVAGNIGLPVDIFG